MPRHLLTVSAIVCLFGAIIFLARKTSQVPLPPIRAAITEPFSTALFYAKFPYASSWQSWWHPQRDSDNRRSVVDKEWNLFYHLGGNGPWIEKVDGIVEGGIGPPESCQVEQVHMVSGFTYSGGLSCELLQRLVGSGSPTVYE